MCSIIYRISPKFPILCWVQQRVAVLLEHSIVKIPRISFHLLNPFFLYTNILIVPYNHKRNDDTSSGNIYECYLDVSNVRSARNNFWFRCNKILWLYDRFPLALQINRLRKQFGIGDASMKYEVVHLQSPLIILYQTQYRCGRVMHR